MNSNLSCSATKCAYNNGNACYAGSIQVDGRQALTTGETRCASYTESSGALTNSVGSGEQVTAGEICCAASSCTYNQNQLCKAKSVKINDYTASCETFATK
ncbi:MAG: DUF1540 domain-containing protein [Clostridioides sp.]|jgi:hypothetical protein|nr:DUF1540 domain-containing protein [Clostridioides sp.]